jgi:hypothetical protein
LPSTPAHKSKMPVPIAKKRPSSPHFISPKSPAIIVTGYTNPAAIWQRSPLRQTFLASNFAITPSL